jgi:hypothetical protein
MTTYLHEQDGVTLAVEWHQDEEGVINFGPIHALDATYRPCGPDLAPLLHGVYVLVSTDPPAVESYLSTLVTAIESERH